MFRIIDGLQKLTSQMLGAVSFNGEIECRFIDLEIIFVEEFLNAGKSYFT